MSLENANFWYYADLRVTLHPDPFYLNFQTYCFPFDFSPTTKINVIWVKIMHKKWDMPPESSDLRYFPDSILILDVQKTCHISTNFQFWPKIFYTPTFYDVGSNISKEIRILETSLSKSPDFAWFLQTMSLKKLRTGVSPPVS